MKQLFCRLRPCVQAYVFLLGVAMVTPTAASAARFSGAPVEDRLLQAPPAFRIHFAAREKPLFMHKPPASLLFQPPAAAVAGVEIAFRHGGPLAVDGETPAAAGVEPGVALFSPEQSRALAEDPPAALRSVPAVSAGGDSLASHIGVDCTRFSGALEGSRLLQASAALHVHFAAREKYPPAASPHPASLLLQLPAAAVTGMEIACRHGGPLAVDGETPTAAGVEPGVASAAPAEDPPAALHPVPVASAGGDSLASHTGAVDTQFSGTPAGDCLLQADADSLAPAVALGRFYMRLEQLRKLLETLRHLSPPHIGADYTRFSGALEGSRLLQAPAALHIHFAAREEYPPAAQPHPASLLLQPLAAAVTGVEIACRHGDPLAVDGAPLVAAPFSPEQRRTLAEDPLAALHPVPVASAGGDSLASHTGAVDTQFSGTPAGDRLLQADADSLAPAMALGRFYTRLEQLRKLLETLRHLSPPHIGAVDTQYARPVIAVNPKFSGVSAEDRLLQASGDNPAPDLALGHFYTRLEQLRKLLKTLRHLRPPHIGADYTRFSGALEGSRLLQAPAALHIHFAAREVPPATPSPPASLLLQPLIATGTERSAASAAPAEAPGSAPFPLQQTRAFAEAPPATLRSAPDIAPGRFQTRLRCTAADLMKSAELPLTICGVAS